MKTLLIPAFLALMFLCFLLLGQALAAGGPGTVLCMHNDDTTTKEIFHVAGDAPDPTGTGLRGTAPGYRFTQTALGHPLCHYSFGPKGWMIVEVDVYALPGQPMYLHLLCPHCQVRSGATNAIRITADQKAMSYDPPAIAATFPDWTDSQMAQAFPRGTGGVLSVARFRCPWEMDPKVAVAQGLSANPMCDFEVVIDKNVIRRVT